MKQTIKGTAKVIANHDSEDNRFALYLYRTKEGKYFLRTEKLQIRRGNKWIDFPMDGSSKDLPKDAIRWHETDTPMTENEAIDWYLTTVAPAPLAEVIRQQIGDLISVDLGELAEPFERYCKDNGVTKSQAIDQAMREHALLQLLTPNSVAVVERMTPRPRPCRHGNHPRGHRRSA